MTAVNTPVDRAQSASILIPIRYQVLIGAIIVQLILGTLYGYSLFWQPLNTEVFPPIITQAQLATMTADGIDTAGMTVVVDEAARKLQADTQKGYLTYAFSICVLAFALTMVFAGRVQDVRGPRQTAIIGGVLMGAGFIIASLMNYPAVFFLAHAMLTGVVGLVALMLFDALLGSRAQVHDNPMLRYVPQAIMITVVVAGVVTAQQFVGRLGAADKVFMLWATVGFLAGVGIGFAYVCPIAALVKWFPSAKGLVVGIAVAGFGFGAYIFKDPNVGAAGYIGSRGISEFFLVHGVICLVGITAGAMLLRNPPNAAAPKTGGASGGGGDSTWRDTLRQPSFYLLWLMYFSGAMAGLMVIGITKGFIQEQLINAAVKAGATLNDELKALCSTKGLTAVGVLSIFNAVGRIVWGLVSDKIGRTPSFVVLFLFQAVAMALLGLVSTDVALYTIASIIGFNYGGIFALFPSATADLFGAKNVGANYGWLFTSYGIAGVIGIAAGNVAKTTTGSYSAAFILAAVLCVASAGLAVILARMIARAKAVPA
ncbi:MAG: OFA family MFS transporter [Phycisphaerales bacterium]